MSKQCEVVLKSPNWQYVIVNGMGHLTLPSMVEVTEAISSFLRITPDQLPLPADISITSGEGLPEDLAMFLGVFRGKWNDLLDHVLVVERIQVDGTVEGVHYNHWSNKPGFERFQGTITSGPSRYLYFGNTSSIITRYYPLDRDTLRGEWVHGRKGQFGSGTFRRQPSSRM